MGLSNFPTAAEGVLPVLVMNSVLSVTLLKNMVRSMFQVMGASNVNFEEDPDQDRGFSPELISRERRISITQFKSLCHNRSCEAKTSAADIGHASTSSTTCICTTTSTSTECCVCLCGFEDEEKVSELSCKHFFHRDCLDKWFDSNHATCPLCRSID